MCRFMSYSRNCCSRTLQLPPHPQKVVVATIYNSRERAKLDNLKLVV